MKPIQPERCPRRVSTAVLAALLITACGGRSASAGVVTLPAGTFEMGSLLGEAVGVAAVRMDVTEVTVDAYRACVDRGRCTAAATHYGCNWDRAGAGSHPINCVDWDQAAAYCEAVGKRLPTEAEWEWAARGAQRGATYPWGDGSPSAEVCWDREGSARGRPVRKSTCAVGASVADVSPHGIHDLAGNVWEWTSAKWNDSGSVRVVRGGSWTDVSPYELRAATRRGVQSDSQYNSLGFRCARSR